MAATNGLSPESLKSVSVASNRRGRRIDQRHKPINAAAACEMRNHSPCGRFNRLTINQAIASETAKEQMRQPAHWRSLLPRRSRGINPDLRMRTKSLLNVATSAPFSL